MGKRAKHFSGLTPNNTLVSFLVYLLLYAKGREGESACVIRYREDGYGTRNSAGRAERQRIVYAMRMRPVDQWEGI